MTRKEKDVSQNERENSPKTEERATMSAHSDVLEMQSLCEAIADRVAASGREKDRVAAIVRYLGVGWNRALEFLRGKARRVDSWEKDYARQQLAALKAAEREQRDREHIAWLGRTLSALQAAPDQDFHGPSIDALQRVLSRVGAPDSTMGDPADGSGGAGR
jgi:hypothetical protein